MKYKAVIFDLFGTLVEKYPLEAYRQELREMATAVSAPEEEFILWWFDTYNDRGTGVFQNYETNIEFICEKLGVRAESVGISRAIEICRSYAKNYLKVKPDAISLLTNIKAGGYKTGIISDCGVEIARVFDRLELAPFFDAVVLSCRVGMQKPDPRVYQMAADIIQVDPEDCLYIGDGDSNELTGAKRVGMKAVLIRNLKEDRDNVYRENFEGDTWQGPVITSLWEVIDLL
jgi:putative hydrolase of the HAD superfamily